MPNGKKKPRMSLTDELKASRKFSQLTGTPESAAMKVMSLQLPGKVATKKKKKV